MKNDSGTSQRTLCEKYGAEFMESPENLKVGIALNVREAVFPIHGVRHPPEGDTTGWYIWAGELSDDVDFFKPLHVAHLDSWCPQLLKYLGLSPGWRFLIANDYEDVWFDPSVLSLADS
jgi:hypothetical protein